MSDNAAGGAFLDKKPRFSRRLVALIVTILLLGVGLGVLFMVLNRPGKSESSVVNYSQVCSDDLITRASQKIAAADVTGMLAIESEVKAIPDYKNDTNCDFILVRGALLRSDATEARAQLTQLKKIYLPYSKAFTIPTMNPDQLEVAVAFSENLAKQRSAASSTDFADQNNAGDKVQR